MIISFDDLKTDQYHLAGGKGGTLARLYQAGYPVPNGFIILPDAFSDDDLTAEAWAEIQTQLTTLRLNNGQTPFAVRSSAMSEDSAQASFAGEFETVLDVKTDAEIQKAIYTVYQSRRNERVQAYSQAQGLDNTHSLAIVVQRLLQSDISGVIFTADPVTGSYTKMVGNFVYGLGEQLVSGETTPETFTLSRPNGHYQGPSDLAEFAQHLFRLAQRLEDELKAPQDIEWAIADNKLYLLQSRPITTLQAHNPITGEWNDSLSGDYLWTRANYGEAITDVMTPYTWSILQQVFSKTLQKVAPVPKGNYPLVGNIGGRLYQNLSLGTSMGAALGKKDIKRGKMAEGTAGQIPDEMEIPIIPFNRWQVIFKVLLPGIPKAIFNFLKAKRHLDAFVAKSPLLYKDISKQIHTAQTPQDLLDCWHKTLAPLLIEAFTMLWAATTAFRLPHTKLQSKLETLVGVNDANVLFAGFNEGATDISGTLPSLGPVLGLAQLAQGQISRDHYLNLYGHRGPHEFELSTPRPAEDPNWLEQQIAEMTQSDVDVAAMLSKQQQAHHAVWQRLQNKHPKQAKSIAKRLKDVTAAAHTRERVRSEFTRLLGLGRTFALRAGKILALDDDIFFLSITEILAALQGDKTTLAYIPARKKTHQIYTALPPYPVIINGRFDPLTWAEDPKRRTDIFDAHTTLDLPDENTLTGFPGSAGIIEGTVRVLQTLDEGHLLQKGEILVTITTNVGWTPLFPRAKAIITDVGAPLSHAAIVARELGIPAVVGCGNATMQLRTGDRVRVNGAQGRVERIGE